MAERTLAAQDDGGFGQRVTTPLCIEFVVATHAAELDGGFDLRVNTELQALCQGFGMLTVREVFLNLLLCILHDSTKYKIF